MSKYRICLRRHREVGGLAEGEIKLRCRREPGNHFCQPDLAIHQSLGAEILLAVRSEREALERGCGVDPGRRHEMFRPEAVLERIALNQIHRRRSKKCGDKRVGRIVVNLFGRADLADPAQIEYRNTVAHAHRFNLIVCDVDRRGANRALELLELVAGRCAPLGIEIRKWLVKKKDAWFAHKRSGQRHPLTLTAGKLPWFALQQTVETQNRRCPCDRVFSAPLSACAAP